MSRKNIALLAASHLLVVVAAVMLARTTSATSENARNADPSKKAVSPATSAGGENSKRTASPFRPATSWKGSEYAKAWKAVRTAKLSTKDRLKTQRELLAQWAKVDLTSAIEAALGEEWDGDNSSFFDPDGPFLDVFGDAFMENPEESWEIIRSKRFGVASGMLRRVWIENAGLQMPVLLAQRFGELSWRDRKQALESLGDGSWELNVKGNRAEIREQIWNALVRLPEDVVSDTELRSILGSELGAGKDIATLKSEMLGLLDANPRMARIMALALGSRLAWNDATDFSAQIQDLPHALRTSAAWSAFDNFESKLCLEAASVLLECEAWDRFESRQMVDRMRILSWNGQAEQVAEWATSMPVRKETTELFYRCVETYLKENMETSREWIAGIENPDWRDRAYAEYSQQALNSHGDPEASRWALNQIQNPTFKTTAEGWRADWERRNSQKSK